MAVLILISMLGSSGWRPLFNGHDLSGWKHLGPGSMTVENGLIRTQGGMGLLYFAGEKFGDCVIRVVYRTEGKHGNSGVFIRIPEEPTEPWMPVHRGYEVQIDDAADDFHTTGALYSLTRVTTRAAKASPEWNTLEIMLDGPQTAVSVNGVKVTDYKEGQPVPPRTKDYEPERGPRPNSGYIGLQNHSPEDVVLFKEISVRPLR
jgi:hypothetical protein